LPAVSATNLPSSFIKPAAVELLSKDSPEKE
jgi:hypothetical protein